MINYRDYYYKYKKEFLRNSFALERSSNKALKYYLKNNSIEKQKRTKGGAQNNGEMLPPPPRLRRYPFVRENEIRWYAGRAINLLQLTDLNYRDAPNNPNIEHDLQRYINQCNIILEQEGADLVTNEEFHAMISEIIEGNTLIGEIERQENRQARQVADKGRSDAADIGGSIRQSR